MRRSTACRLLSCLSIAGVLVFVVLSAGGAGPPALAEAMPSRLPADRAEVAATGTYTVYLPFARVSRWEPAPLLNGGFEGGWWRETLSGQAFGEIFVPESWVAFWDDGPYPLGRPEMKIIPAEAPFLDPPRVYSGTQALQWFHFYHSGDAGVMQQVAATPGARYRAKAYTHVWYSMGDDAYVSEWEKDDTWYTIEDGDPGMEVMLGIDPHGGTNPWSGDVVWDRANIYDQFEMLSVGATAEASTVTVFVRALALYPFKHGDAYWDEVTLEVME